jgi:hypothetical protein
MPESMRAKLVREDQIQELAQPLWAASQGSQETWIQLCPYGMWTCLDGRQVLHNRYYWPILERAAPDAPTLVARSGEWVDGIAKEEWFFDWPPWKRYDYQAQKRAAASLSRVNAILADWGLPPLVRPPRAPRPSGKQTLCTPFKWAAPGSIPKRPHPWAAILGPR